MSQTKLEISPEKKVGELVAAAPVTSRVFRKYAVDFCCGGGVSLQDVCSRKGLDTRSIIAELDSLLENAVESGRDWSQTKSIDELIDYIIPTFHEPLVDELPRLGELMAKVASVHGDGHPELLLMNEIYQSLKLELELHMEKEEHILFPMMRELYKAQQAGESMPELSTASVNTPMGDIEAEHDSAGEALRNLRKHSNEYILPEGACNSYRALYDGLERLEEELHKHIHLENYVLHPLASRIEAKLGDG